MTVKRLSAIVVAGSLFVCINLSAHHGGALYDTAETVTIRGEVTEFRFVFPHVLVYFASENETGEVVEWSGELTTPNRLARGVGGGGTTNNIRWENDTLVPGDVIEVTGNPARNNAPSMRIRRIVDDSGLALIGGEEGAAAPAVEVASAGVPSTTPAETGADLTGVWIRRYEHAYENYAFTADLPPMTAWARARFDASKPTFGPRGVAVADTNDPAYQCLPPGTPRIYAHPAPFEIVQSPERVLIVYEYQHLTRQIITDGSGHRQGRPASWMGESVGHWDGDVLVVESVNFNDRTWIDRRGVPHSDQLRVVERIRRSAENELTVDITVEDPIAFTEPWTSRRVFDTVDWRLEENVCLDDQSFQEFERTLIEFEDDAVSR